MLPLTSDVASRSTQGAIGEAAHHYDIERAIDSPLSRHGAPSPPPLAASVSMSGEQNPEENARKAELTRLPRLIGAIPEERLV